MIYTHCPRCRKRIEVGTKCPCYERTRAIGKGNRLDIDSFYNSPEWRAARSEAISKTHGLDVYSLYVDHIIERGYTVHHITPLAEDLKKRIMQSNLIYLTEAHHRMIHELYKTDKQKTISLLKNLLRRFEHDFNSPSSLQGDFLQILNIS